MSLFNSVASRPRFFSLAGLFVLTGMTSMGCQSSKTPPSYVENIAVQYSFTNVDKPEDRERVYNIVEAIAVSNTLQPDEVPTTPDFELRFVVKRLSALDEAHALILFVPQPGGHSGEFGQMFNPRDPTFSIKYDTISIGGGIEVIVRFKVTPGAQLFYKPQGGALIDVTNKVSESGNVSFTTQISRGQEYFYAKAISGGVTKWLKINVFSQQVQEITQREFDELK